MCHVECCVAGRRQDPDTGLKLKMNLYSLETLFKKLTLQNKNKKIRNLKHEIETTVDSRN